MKREIKFRGKKHNGSWVYGDLCTPANRFISIRENRYTYNGISHEEYEVYEDTIGQFTGLTDKNGREIFEGDVIKFHFMTSSPSTSELFPTKKFFGEITTNKYNQWTILSDGLEIHIENAIKYGEIIGNIYDNKELLED
jgi:uncharacterized phage protein (TIGR01671 family)|nr:MAG TPA: YopX protein [Caudoviricetes sp.]